MKSTEKENTQHHHHTAYSQVIFGAQSFNKLSVSLLLTSCGKDLRNFNPNMLGRNIYRIGNIITAPDMPINPARVRHLDNSS